MGLTRAVRIVTGRLVLRPPRESYWNARKRLVCARRLLRPANRAFAAHVLREHAVYLFGRLKPVSGQTRERIEAAAGWLMRAQDATPDDGVAYGYFPCDTEPGWLPSYPETTGYIVPSLLTYARRFGRPDVRDRAMRMARWELDIQMSNGACQGGRVCPPEEQTPAAFNTGMMLDGYLAAYEESGEQALLEAAHRAADYLLGDLDEHGQFRTPSSFVRPGESKTYCCLCAWPIFRFGQLIGDERYMEAAIRVIEGAIRLQQPNGWFASNDLDLPRAPLLHTIGYTLQGILEVGILAKRTDFIESARRGTDPILAMCTSGYLPGRIRHDWLPVAFSSCLTGSAQVAIVAYRLQESLGEREYGEFADTVVDYLKALQSIRSTVPEIDGGLAGSFPLFGGYMTAGYPNWATKYFLDALMFQDQLTAIAR